MTPIATLLESGLETSIDELRQEIKEREDMLPQLVGWLYPPIIQAEIDKIEQLINEADTNNP